MTHEAKPLERIPQRKVWVQVEIAESRPGEERPRLLHSVDPERAREALAELRAFTPGGGPPELFNTQNEMYTPRRSIFDVAEEHGVSRETLFSKLFSIGERRIDAERVEPERAAKRKVRLHSDLMAALERRSEMSPGVLAGAAPLIGITPEQLREECKGDDDAPFFSEAYLYTLVGKDAARSILSRLRQLREALGVES